MEQPKVLLAEDNEINARVVLAALRQLQYTVEHVWNGAEALDAWRRGGYGLILMDCMMPEVDGFEAARRIREEEQGSGARIPIVAVTALAHPEDRQRALDAGMDDLVVKPVRVAVLRSVVQAWMAR